MPLSKDIYRELEDIVGPDNISDDEVVLDSYVKYAMVVDGPPTSYFPRHTAIVLPGCTADVQAILKLCHRRGLQSKASSTGYGLFSAPGNDNVILLDMRRMNRIIDIDEKNMVAIVEPYVSFAELQGEAMRRGLNCHIIGAGSNASYLASMTSVVGNNTQAISQGYSGRNLLGVEWVLPTGEVVRLGAPGAGAGWFSGDGPGPSLRGIMRGAHGATGGLGVFTKCAGHLHPWPGPAKMEIRGKSPYYEAEIPPFFEYHIIEWPTWEQCADAQYKIGESGIAFAIHKTGGPGSHGSIVTGNNNEYYEIRKAGGMSLPEVSWAIVTAAGTAAEHAYQIKVLNRIMEETEGRICPTGEDATWKNRDFINMVKACFIPRLAFRTTGSFATDWMMAQESIDNCAMTLARDGRLRDKYAEKGVIMDDGTYNNWGVTYEGGHFGLLEGGHLFDPWDKQSMQGFSEMAAEGMEIAKGIPTSLGWMAVGAQAPELGLGEVVRWMRKIKKSFDPDTVSDPFGYISAEENGQEMSPPD